MEPHLEIAARTSKVTLPRLMIIVVIFVGLLWAAIDARALGLQGLRPWFFYVAVLFFFLLALVVVSTVSFVLYERRGWLPSVTTVRDQRFRRVNDHPTLKYFILREAIR